MFHSEPKPKKLKTTPIERKATLSSSWQEDPRAITDLSAGQQSSIPEYHRHWHQISKDSIQPPKPAPRLV